MSAMSSHVIHIAALVRFSSQTRILITYVIILIRVIICMLIVALARLVGAAELVVRTSMNGGAEQAIARTASV